MTHKNDAWKADLARRLEAPWLLELSDETAWRIARIYVASDRYWGLDVEPLEFTDGERAR